MKKNGDYSFLVTNSIQESPQVRSIKGRKVWDDNDNPNRPEAITLLLIKNGDLKNPLKEKTISELKDAWTFEFKDLKIFENNRKIEYTIVEKSVDGYKSVVEYNGDEVLITNVLLPEKPEDPKVPDVPEDPKVPDVPEDPKSPKDPEKPNSSTPKTGIREYSIIYSIVIILCIIGLKKLRKA